MDGKTERVCDTERERETDRQTDRLTNRDRDSQTETETDSLRQGTEIERYRGRETDR